MRINKRFNRVETDIDHYYGSFEWKGAASGQTRFEGFLKCKLGHGTYGSLVIPDQILVQQGSTWGYVQPIHFTPPVLIFFDGENRGHQLVDIACGTTVAIDFSTSGLQRTYEDGSQLYACSITGPDDLPDYCTGAIIFEDHQMMFMEMFHHTTEIARDSILAAGHFRTSDYNIQGTTKRLQDRAYAYLTPIDKIACDGDLRALAMERSGKLLLQRDGFIAPSILAGDRWWEKYKDDVLALDVYPSTPENRSHAVNVWSDASLLAPQHLFAHFNGTAWYYEVACPLTHRVGTNPGKVVEFDNAKRILRTSEILTLDYVVVGNATTLKGLEAPYDEEDTSDILKIVRIDQDFPSYWKANANRDLYSSLPVNLQRFL